MARTQEPTVDDCERINVIESTTVDSTSHDNPTLKIQIPKLEGVSFNFEFESEVIVCNSRILLIENPCLIHLELRRKFVLLKWAQIL